MRGFGKTGMPRDAKNLVQATTLPTRKIFVKAMARRYGLHLELGVGHQATRILAIAMRGRVAPYPLQMGPILCERELARAWQLRYAEYLEQQVMDRLMTFQLAVKMARVVCMFA